jgi:hypothetical protein
MGLSTKEPQVKDQPAKEPPAPKKRVFRCDRCGCEMVERSCKVVCKNCGNRFDCSDLNIYFD